MQVTVTAAGAIFVGMAIVYALARAMAEDGYGKRPPPRSHRDEVAITQHERLRRLAR